MQSGRSCLPLPHGWLAGLMYECKTAHQAKLEAAVGALAQMTLVCRGQGCMEGQTRVAIRALGALLGARQWRVVQLTPA